MSAVRQAPPRQAQQRLAHRRPDRAPGARDARGAGFTDADLAKPLIGVATT